MDQSNLMQRLNLFFLGQLLILCTIVFLHWQNSARSSNEDGDLKAFRKMIQEERIELQQMILSQSEQLRELTKKDSILQQWMRKNETTVNILKQHYHASSDSIGRFDAAAIRRAYAALQD